MVNISDILNNFITY